MPKWTDQENHYLETNRDLSPLELTKRFNRKFKSDRSYDSIQKKLKRIHQSTVRVVSESVPVDKRTKRYVITTAVNAHRVCAPFLHSLESYCSQHKAELLILPCYDTTGFDQTNAVYHLDRILTTRKIVSTETQIHKHLMVSSVKVTARQLDPTTGMDPLVQRLGGFVFASPKQRLRYVPTLMSKHPRPLMSTGAVTLPDYRSLSRHGKRLEYFAREQHIMGALIVDVLDAEHYEFRHVQCVNLTTGAFTDDGVLYRGPTKHPVCPEAFVCGDLHAWFEDPEVREYRTAALKRLKPRVLVLHDVFDGISVTHHNHKLPLSRAVQSRMTLEEELENLRNALKYYGKYVKKIVIVPSNHDDHLSRYLDEARFVHDRANYRLALTLAAAMYDGLNPLAAGVGDVGVPVEWLPRDASYEVAGIELGQHGDKGPNGSKGGTKSLDKSFEKSVLGHTHTAEMLNGTYRVGVSTAHLGYCSGPSSWTNTDCAVYSDGTRQLVNYIRKNR